jgi:hypothetical protein
MIPIPRQAAVVFLYQVKRKTSRWGNTFRKWSLCKINKNLIFTLTQYIISLSSKFISTHEWLVQNYLLVDNSLSTISRIWSASCGASARLPARNWPKWCKFALATNLITTLYSFTLLGKKWPKGVSWNWIIQTYQNYYYVLKNAILCLTDQKK